jgi:hypothetical protein
MKSNFAMIGAIALAIFISGPLSAQTNVLVRRAELSVLFGTISGSLVVVSDQMVFMDKDKPEDSFAIARGEISSFKTDNNILMVTTRQAIRVRAEERTEFNFLLREGSPETISMWAGLKPATSTVSPTSSTAPATPPTPVSLSNNQEQKWTYNARHSHRFGLGSCTGKLIITRDRVVYESLEKPEDSRQFPLNEIKKIKRNNPYKIEIDTFNRDNYELDIEGQGMDISVFRTLEGWIVGSRQ